MNMIILFAGLGLMIFAVGCGPAPVQTTAPVCVPGEQVETVMADAQAVLERMQFKVEKADIEQGYIRTRPLTGAQFFEFWRDDNVGQYNTAEANLQTVRRTVEINVSREQGQVCADCIVTVERMSLPEREAVSTSRSASLFTKSSSGVQRLQLNPDQQKGMTWMDLGRDGRLEAEILKRLNKSL
ncbi:MAG: hypothetical protein WC962_01760 [Phycisphaerae bacterium]|jgi:hypothetical protein